jgi:hypothetical protein
VPFDGFAVAVPFDAPLQVTALTLVVTLNAADGWMIVTEAVPTHKFASVTVTIYVPAARLTAVEVV